MNINKKPIYLPFHYGISLISFSKEGLHRRYGLQDPAGRLEQEGKAGLKANVVPTDLST